jgi:hypothetical protein
MPKVVFLYVLLMPFTSALAPSEWAPLPLLLLIVIMPLLLIMPTRVKLVFVLRNDWPFILMFCVGLAAIFFSSLPSGSKNLNHSLAVITCYFFYFYTARRLLCCHTVRWDHIGLACQWSLGVLSLGVVFEFYLASYHGVFFADVIHFAHADLPVADLITADFKRPRAFAVAFGRLPFSHVVSTFGST